MQEKTLLKLSLVVGLGGIVLLYFLSSGIDLEAVPGIEELEADTEVKVTGKIGKVTELDTVAFLELWQEKIMKTTVVLFKDSNISLQAGDYVEISGTVEDYEGKKEVIGNKVVKK
jgi:aspartyl/asparaginyl-tRNA synthetase